MVRPSKHFGRPSDQGEDRRPDRPRFVKGRLAATRPEATDWSDVERVVSKYTVRSVSHHLPDDGTPPTGLPAADSLSSEPEADTVDLDLRDPDAPVLTFYQRRSAHLPRLEDARKAEEAEG